MDLTTVEKNLKRARLQGICFATAKEAADYLNAQIDGESVSFGGSMTLAQMGFLKASASTTQCSAIERARRSERRRGAQKRLDV